uniref:Prostaglandin E synthase 2 n=1 Tax=Peronospora matthiolae TaxID=2874970 RepID=A0AAV1UEL1_9STRA
MLHRSVTRLACGLRSTSSALAHPSAPKRFVPTTTRFQSHISGSASLLLQKWRFVAAIAVSTSASCAYCSTGASVTDTVNTNRAVPKVVLYQYEPCPYCCKVKTVLDYLKLPYDVVEVNPLTKKETKAVTEYAKVPVVTIGNDVVVDSSAIITRLWDLAVPAKSSQLEHKEPQEEETQWCQWVDQKLIVLTPPNIYRTLPEALQAFDYCLAAGNFTSMERHLSKYVGAMVMYLIAKRSKKKYGIDDERLALYAALNSWVDAVGDKRPFLGGHEPNKADLSVFGVLRAMHGLDTYNDVMRETKIGPWFRCMTDRVGSSSRTASKQLENTVKE